MGVLFSQGIGQVTSSMPLDLVELRKELGKRRYADDRPATRPDEVPKYEYEKHRIDGAAASSSTA